MLKMKDCGGEYYVPYCSFHPKEVVVGICALCLRERLLNLVLKQGHHHHTQKDYSRPFRALRRKTGISLPKVFALGSFLRPRPDSDGDSDRGSSASLEDSFISIKFEDNGEASWERKKKEDSIVANNTNVRRQVQEGKVLVEQSKPRPTTSLRWRKRMGQLLQVARWKRAAAGGAGGGSHVEVGRKGWMRSLTARRRTTES